jgi:hypothetical protein
MPTGADDPGKNAPKPRGRPFAKGNPGRPKGVRNKTTEAIETLLDGEGLKLTRKAIKQALAGDSALLRNLMDRLAPVRKERRVKFPLPPIVTTGDVVTAMASVVAAMADGKLSPAEAHEIAAVIELQRAAIQTRDNETLLRQIEEKFR